MQPTNNAGIGYVSQDQVNQPTAQPKHTGNWMTHLLPTAGGILGGIVGIPGDLVSGGLASVGGAAVGSGLGKALENKLEGNKNIGSGVLANTVEGGIGEGVGGLVGKGIGKGAEMLAGRAKGITDTAKVATDAASEDAAKLAEANAIKNNFGGVKPGVQSSNNLAGNQELLKSWGLDHTDPQVMADASKGGLFIHGIDESALGAGSPIKTTNLISSKDITTASPEEQQALVKAGIITPEGALPTHVTPIQANKFAQDLNGQVRDMQSTMANAKANGRVADYNAAKEQYTNLNKLYKNVQNLSASPGVNESIVARTISPEEKQQLVEQFGDKQANHIEEQINNAKTHQDLVNAKLPFAQMNDLSSQALQDLKATATPRAVARGKSDINGDGIADVALTSPLIDAAHATANAGHGGILSGALTLGKHAVNNPQILDTLSRMGALTSKIAPGAGVATATTGNLGASPVPVDGSQPVGGTMDTMNNGTQAPVGGGNNYQQLVDAMQAQAVLAPTMGGGASSFLGQIAPQLQKNQLASSELAALPASFANAGGAQGEGGILSRISGLIPGTAAHTYQAQQQAAAAQLGQALGISPQAAMGLLPQLMQNQQSAGISGGILNNLQGQLAY
jgi:hypothetical protein